MADISLFPSFFLPTHPVEIILKSVVINLGAVQIATHCIILESAVLHYGSVGALQI